MKTLIIIPLISVLLAFVLSLGKSRKAKYMIWGLTISIVIAPFSPLL